MPELTLTVPQEHYDELTATGLTAEEAAHRAIRMYREMENPEEFMAETDLMRAVERGGVDGG